MKKKLLASVLCIAMGVTLLAGCGRSNSNTGKKEDNTQNAKAEETTVTLFAAKSLNSVMDELIAEYNKTNPNVKIVGSYDSSGTLLTQPAAIKVLITSVSAKKTALIRVILLFFIILSCLS